MGLMDEIATLNKPRSAGCVIAETLGALDKQDAADLEAALADATIQHRAIGKALIARGVRIGQDGKAIARHRKGECSCHR